MARQKNTPVSNGGIVVGCKLPHGLILKVENEELELNGTNTSNVIGGYGLTENVDPSFFAAWCQINHQHPALENGLIFAQSTAAEATAQADDNAQNRNGFEGIDPAKPGNGVEPADEKTA